MSPKAKRKLFILAMNLMTLTILLVIQENKVDNILDETAVIPNYQEVLLKSTLMVHNSSAYDWIAIICISLLIINMFFYRQWVKSKKWILEPILILVVTYGLTFSFYTYRTFEIRDQLIEEKRIKY